MEKDDLIKLRDFFHSLAELKENELSMIDKSSEYYRFVMGSFAAYTFVVNYINFEFNLG